MTSILFPDFYRGSRQFLVNGLSSTLLQFLVLLSIPAYASSAPDKTPEDLLQVLHELIPSAGSQGKVVYVSRKPLMGGHVITSWNSAHIVPETYGYAWFYFIDDMPGANWEHPCRYVFIDTDTKMYRVQDGRTPPDDLAEMIELFPGSK